MRSQKLVKVRARSPAPPKLSRASDRIEPLPLAMRLDAFADYIRAIDREIQASIEARTGAERLYWMMEYHLGWRDQQLRRARAPAGKRSRSLICLLSCGAVGGPMASLVPVAAAVELVHQFSLIFDDIQDGSPLRRNRPAVWSLWGVPQAINVAAGMQALVNTAVLRAARYGVPERRMVAVLHRMTETIMTLCEGQFRDLECETQRDLLTPAEYLEICAAKTASLIQTAAYLGALWGTHDVAKLRAFEEFGYGLGMAYQLFNDIEGVWGGPEKSGKLPDDLTNRKQTLPTLMAFEQAESDSAIRALRDKYCSAEPLSSADIALLHELLAAVDARTRCVEQLVGYKDLALRALERTGEENEYIERLRRLVAILLPTEPPLDVPIGRDRRSDDPA
ncbi:MAG TPA: polyprenyl synthetase family protein [Limnochordia bacterium]